jgi:hypothetical protein
VRLDPDRARLAGLRFLTAPRPGVLIDIVGADRARRVPGVEQLVVTAVPGRPVRPAEDAYDRFGYVIAVGDAPGQIEESLDAAMALLDIHICER